MATFTSTVTENVTINGVDQGGSTTRTVTGINNVFKRQVTCTASQTTTVLTFAASVHTSVQALDVDDVRYIRITNKDSTNAIELAMVAGSTNYTVELGAGESHILGPSDGLMLVDDDSGTPSFGTMADLDSVQVNPGGNAVSVELFVASV